MAGNYKIIVTSGMRTGSTWLSNIIGSSIDDPFIYLNEENSEKYMNYGFWPVDGQLIKSHGIIPKRSQKILEDPDVKIVVVSRDYCDAMDSRYYYARYHDENSDLHKLIEAHDLIIDDCPDEEFIELLHSDYPQFFNGWLESLKEMDEEFNHERIFRIKYEEMIKGEWDGVRSFLNIPDFYFREAVKRHSFENRQKHEKLKFPERIGNSLFYRKGKVGTGRLFKKWLK